MVPFGKVYLLIAAPDIRTRENAAYDGDDGRDRDHRPDDQHQRQAQYQKLEMVKQRLESLFPPRLGCGPEMGPVFISTIIYKPMYDHLVEDLALTQDQQQKLKQLLLERRSKFLSHGGQQSSPSLKLGDMIPPPPLENKKEGIQ